jgi:hypothetical protein
MKSNNWIVIEKSTGKAIMETWSANVINDLTPDYKVVPAYEYLVNLNREIKESNHTVN